MPSLKDHPVIERIQRTGYAEREKHSFRTDSRGTTIHEGDVLLELDDHIYVESELLHESVEILRLHGAERSLA